jgi:uncharacterized protein (TIGR03083 family)
MGLIVTDHVDALVAEAELFLAALRRADPAAPVPNCPEWTVRELAHHTGRVHRWAASYPRDGRLAALSGPEEELVWGVMPDDADLVDWFAEGSAALVETLLTVPGDVACWSFLPAPSPLAFWARRQAHETTVHRVDIEGALGYRTPVSTAFAVDGVDELLLGFFSRKRTRLRSANPLTLTVVATDDPARWQAHIGPDGARAQRCDAAVSAPAVVGDPVDADAVIAGPAASLYLGLWNRSGLGELDRDGDVVFTGDPAVLELWRRHARVTWS